MSIAPIKIEGLAQFSKDLKKIDANLPKALRVALNASTDVIVNHAKPKIPVRTGRAARTLKSKSTRTAARVSAGSKRVPYYPWLDFGGTVGKNKATKRPFMKKGRYIYSSYDEKKEEFTAILEKSLLEVVRASGIEVT